MENKLSESEKLYWKTREELKKDIVPYRTVGRNLSLGLSRLRQLSFRKIGELEKELTQALKKDKDAHIKLDFIPDIIDRGIRIKEGDFYLHNTGNRKHPDFLLKCCHTVEEKSEIGIIYNNTDPLLWCTYIGKNYEYKKKKRINQNNFINFITRYYNKTVNKP